MKIGIDIRHLCERRTGVGGYMHGLLSALFELDSEHEYFLISSGMDRVDLPELEVFPNVHRVHIRIPNKLLHLLMVVFRYPRIDRLGARVAGIAEFDLWLSGNIHFMSLSSTVRYIAIIHDLTFVHVPDTFSWQRRIWHRLVMPVSQIERADSIITNSAYTRSDIIRTFGISSDSISIIYPGPIIDMDYESEVEIVKKKYSLPEKYVLCIATIEPRKNISALIEAFVSSSLSNDGYELVIVGGSGWSSEHVLTRLHEIKSVRYLGFVSVTEKTVLLHLAHMFAYVSLFEGFGMPVLEAMAMGVPVIAGSNSSMLELMDGAGRAVNSLSVGDISGALRELGQDETLRKKYAKLGIERSRMFSWGESARRFNGIFSKYEKTRYQYK
jgi:glycosyltransferase involved in cell wall biosynthesis